MAIAKSGQITVTTAGTAVQGPTAPMGSKFALKADPDNTGAVYVGNVAGDVSDANGFPLEAQDAHVVVRVSNNLSELWFDAAVDGEKICWLLLE